MSWHQTTAANGTYSDNQTSASTDSPSHVITYHGIQASVFDDYEYTGGPDRWTQFSVDTAGWPNKVSQFKYWIRVHPHANFQTTVATTDDTFNFMFYWCGDNNPAPFEYDHIDQFTVNFAPIEEAKEAMPENFMKFLERIGHDDDYLRLQLGKQKQHWEAVGKKPPWDPERIEELEQERVRMRERLVELEPIRQEQLKEKLMERWGIEEIPPITPELLDQIESRSRQFLEECLSPDELEFFDEHGHCKVKSNRDPEVYYIVKVNEHQRVKKYIEDKLVEEICIHSAWGSMPALDTVAMKVLNIKHNEDGFLEVGNITRIR